MKITGSFRGLILFFIVIVLSTGMAREANYGTDPSGLLGAMEPDPEEIKKVQPWQPEPMGTAGPPSVDLRTTHDGKRLFPMPGRQKINDCTAWAVAYNIKSYLEAVDQGWKPDAGNRLFSPTFVYNQVNQGVNRGAPLIRALKLLKNTGCATLKTAPYTPWDFRTRPSRQAYAEARNFRIKDFRAINSLAKIKLALQQGRPVLVGMVTDPEFCGGRWEVYTKTIRRRNMRLRDYSARHGRHAMVIVGYDDIRGALLFMNSWGPRWNGNGFCWVSYNVIGRVAYDRARKNFLQEAYVLIDEPNKISAPPRPDREIAEPEVSGRSWYAGLILNKPSWFWKIYLTADKNVLRKIVRVQWRIPGGLRHTKKRTPPGRWNNYEVNGISSSRGVKKIKAVISFRGGKKITKSIALNFKPSSRGALRLVQASRYYGRIEGQPNWRWYLRIKGSLADMNDIKKVIYHLHPTFKNPNREVRSSPKNGFAFSARGWGTFAVKATVLFKDNTTRKLGIHLRFNDPVRDTLTLTNTAFPLGKRGETFYYSWTAFINGPLRLIKKIKQVDYYLHPTFRPNRVRVSSGSRYGFPLARSG
ncbi:MAG: hypothetical protein GY754_42805 [bacterium]|nr:hypothetical protein [bacterium]